MLCTFSTRTQPIIKAEKPPDCGSSSSFVVIIIGGNHNCDKCVITVVQFQYALAESQYNNLSIKYKAIDVQLQSVFDLVWGLQIGQWCSPDHSLHSFQVVMNLQRFQIRYCVNRSILSNNKAMWYNPLLWTAQALKTIRTNTT